MGIFRGGGGGVKFSWMLGFVVICGQKIVVGSGLNHTCRALASSFEVKAMVRGYRQYKGLGCTTPCSAALFPIIAFCSGVYFPYWPLAVV